MNLKSLAIATVMLSVLGCPAAEPPAGVAWPKVTVTNLRRVFHNGEHNAFTDLVKFRGRYYLVYRSCPDGHMVNPTASIVILASDDTKVWTQVHRFSVARRDTRDPHFLVFRARLFVYTGTWYSGATTLPRGEYDLNKHLGYAAVSDDGSSWRSPILPEGTFGRYVVGGRKQLPDRTAKTSLAWLVGDRLQEVAEFPSGGDNSYPGWVETGPGRALVSYYSSHERDAAGKTITAIYLADLAVEK